MRNYQIYFIRHGFTPQVGKGVLGAGKFDSPLSEKAVIELNQYREAFEYPKVDKVYTSPLKSCTQTVNILYPSNFVQIAEGLRDIDLGDFEGKTVAELTKDQAYLNWVKNSLAYHPPGGESTQEFLLRVQASFEEIVKQMVKEKTYRVAVVTHASVLMQLLFSFGLPKRALHRWNIGYGKGVSSLLNLQMWSNDKLFAVAGIVPYGAAGLE